MAEQRFAIKSPTNLSPRIQWLRDYYFQGVKRAWNNEFTAWTTGTPWDFQFNEITFYIVPETYTFFQTFRASVPAGGAAESSCIPTSGPGASRSAGPGSCRR